MDEPSTREFERAKALGEARLRGPRAESARYDAGRNRVVIRSTTGIEIAFAPRDVEGLENAPLDDLRAIEIEAFGLGVRFPRLDADLYVPALLKGILGSSRWMAARAIGDAGRRAPVRASSQLRRRQSR